MEQQKQVFQTFFNMHYCEILLQYTHTVLNKKLVDF